MKKLFAMLLALAMLLGMIAVAEDVTFDYTGEWALTSAQASGITLDPTMLGLEMSMLLYEDGTCTLTTGGLVNEEETGAWVLIEGGIAVTDADAVTMNMLLNEEGALTTDQDGVVLIFTRGGAEAETLAVLAGVPAEYFEGAWMLSGISMFGMYVPAEEAGAYMAFQIAGGEGIYVETDENGEPFQLNVTYTVTEVEEAGTVLDLIYSDETLAEPVVLLSLNMLEDGTLYSAMDMEGLVVEFFFDPLLVEEAAAE